jgi:hypothetical protein
MKAARRVQGKANHFDRDDSPRFTVGLWLALLIAGGFLLAHGCHGDEDNELLVEAAAARHGDGR